MGLTRRQRLIRRRFVRRTRPLWRPLYRRLRNLWLAAANVPGLLVSPERRALLAEMRAFVRDLPARLETPLPQVMNELTAVPAGGRPTPAAERKIRDLADIAVLVERGTPLGICLRRSLTRYYFLRRAGLPLDVHFGAKFKNGKPDRSIAGHAWVTLDGRPYFEPGKNWRGFTIMLTFPK